MGQSSLSGGAVVEPWQCSTQSRCCSSAEEGPLVGGCVSSPGVGKAAAYTGSLSLHPAFPVRVGQKVFLSRE